MQDRTQRFVMSRFRKYYASEKLSTPERLSRREFGFMFFDRNFVLRHLGFRNRNELGEYIIEHVPSHVYHSAAYYKKPNAPTMPEKGWMGADLIFDLDADHVRGIEGLGYPEMLERVKGEMIKLLDWFITGDLGFDQSGLKIVFSGGRGYHIHVSDPRVLSLGSHERREIVDYITGTDLDIDWVFPSSPFDAKHFAQRTKTLHRRRMPDMTAGGWRRRMRDGIGRFLIDLEVMGENEAASKFSDTTPKGSRRAIGEKTVRKMHKELFSVAKDGKRGVDMMREDGIFEVFSSDLLLNAFLGMVENHVKVSLEGETDEPVTSDIKRLIRLPSSLHGKTGLRVVSLTRREIDDFDPLRDAIPSSLGDSPVKMNIQKDVDIRLRDERFSLREGENEVPEFAVLFLACRQFGTVL